MRDSWCWLKRRYWAGFCCRICWALVSLKDDTCQLDATAGAGVAVRGARGPGPARPCPLPWEPGAPLTLRVHVMGAHGLRVLHQVGQGPGQLHGLLLPGSPAGRAGQGQGPEANAPPDLGQPAHPGPRGRLQVRPNSLVPGDYPSSVHSALCSRCQGAQWTHRGCPERRHRGRGRH